MISKTMEKELSRREEISNLEEGELVRANIPEMGINGVLYVGGYEINKKGLRVARFLELNNSGRAYFVRPTKLDVKDGIITPRIDLTSSDYEILPSREVPEEVREKVKTKLQEAA